MLALLVAETIEHDGAVVWKHEIYLKVDRKKHIFP